MHGRAGWQAARRAIIALGLLGAGISPAAAQFICAGSATGNEPQDGASASAGGGSVACGFSANASGTGLNVNSAFGNAANGSGNDGHNSAFWGRANASGNTGGNTA